MYTKQVLRRLQDCIEFDEYNLDDIKAVIKLELQKLENLPPKENFPLEHLVIKIFCENKTGRNNDKK